MRAVGCFLSATLASLAMLASSTANATGMQGHMYMGECAIEHLPDGRLRTILEDNLLSLQNGAFFPDSGYATDDYDQGEIPHWEQYVQGMIEVLRERWPSPMDDPEAAPHVAFLMGIAAHGITDSTFDPLLYARAEQVDPGDPSSFDMAMDALLVRDLPRYHVPELSFDADLLSQVFLEKIPHDVTPEEISDAMSTARAGIGAVTVLISRDAASFEGKYPWGAASYLDPRVPGGYPFGASVVARYYQEIERRLEGDTSAAGVLIGSYPSDGWPMVTLDRTRADGRIALYFGQGLSRDSIGDGAVTVLGPNATPFPVKASPFRGDQWVNAILVEPIANWEPATEYTVVVSQSIATLYGVSPASDLTFSFTTCSAEGAGTCAPPSGQPPASPCPIADARYTQPPGEEEPLDPTPPTAETTSDGDSGCSIATSKCDRDPPWTALVALGAFAVFTRRAARATPSRTVRPRRRRARPK